MADIIRVGMAKLAVARAPTGLETQALGSCVGIVLYDSYTKTGGMAHVMLPDIELAKESSRGNPAKFANTAIDVLVEKMEKMGVVKRHIEAKLAGGANMFPDISTKDPSEAIGNRNIESARARLLEIGIPIVAEDVGGSVGRTISLNTTTGDLIVRCIRQGEKVI